VIAAGTEVLLDADADLGSLKIDGTLKWDLTKDDLTLKSGFIVAEGPEGTFEMGTPEDPMLNKATIYIKNNGKEHSSRLGSRVFGVVYSVGSPAGKAPSVKVHGRPLPKTWSLMVKNTEEGDNSIEIEGDVANADSGIIDGGNWKVGDRIGIAPAGMMGERIGEAFNIKSLISDGTTTVITLDGNLEEPKLGRADLRLQCEVVLLSRNVLMTGDDTSDSGQGWHGIAAAGQFASDPKDGGSFQIEYARQERCGQARIKGSYCLHFHLMGDCGYDEANGDPLRPRCLFRGNALENGYQRGLTVHGTHRSMVDNNVLWNVKGAGLYVEDGNEMGNKIQYNVNICPYNKGGCHNCKVWATDNGEADNGQQSGMWAMSPTNDFLFNRMVNHWNGFFMQTSFAPYGRGFAEFKVCTVNSPWGNFTGNVHHSNCRFGFYPDKNWPRRVDRSIATNGMVKDFQNSMDNNPDTWSSCQQFTKDGRDNGAPGIAADGLDWGNNLVGQYDLGDIQYLRYHSVNNLHGMYWKATKNFARRGDWGSETWDIGIQGQQLEPQHLISAEALPWSHMKNCKFQWLSFWDYPDVARIMGTAASGVGHLYGPGGHGTFILEGGMMTGMMGAAVGSNQHCDLAGTGGLCAPTFEVNNVDFSKLHANTPLVFFGVSGGDSRMVSYAGQVKGDLPGPGVEGYLGVAQAAQEYLLHLRDPDTKAQLCSRGYDVNLETAEKFNWGIVCERKLRRIQYFEKQLDPWPTIKIKSESHTPQELLFVRPFFHLKYKRGYGMAVMPGFHYEIDKVENFPGENNAAFEFSDQIYGDEHSPYEEDTATFTFIKKNGATRTCTVKSSHDRTWLGWEGNLAEPYGEGKAVGACLVDDSGSDGAPTTPAPTPPPTPAPPTPAPVPTTTNGLNPVPAPSPIGPAPGDCKEDACPDRPGGWPADMYECTVGGIVGTEIRTDGGMRKCNDCAERCWFQIPDCIGVLQGGLGEVESCTYYSAILGTVEGGSKRAIVKSLAFGSFKPLPLRPTPGAKTPDGCNSHLPPRGPELGDSMYMCLVSNIYGDMIDTTSSDTALDFYNDCSNRCFIQGIEARDGTRHTCVAVSAEEIGTGVKCKFYSSITNLTTDTVSNIGSSTTYAMIANSSVPWHLKAGPSPGPSPSPQEPSTPVPNWLVPTMLVVGGVLLSGVAFFACKSRRELYGPQVDATEMS